MITHRNRMAILAALAVLALTAAPALAAVRTLNLDFGNAGVHSGDDGILSAPGGTHWNEVTLQAFHPNSGIATQFNVPALRDEFGQLIPFAELMTGFADGVPNTDSAQAPLNDGFSVNGGQVFFGLALRSFTSNVPIDLVVYFNSPVTPASPSSVVTVNPLFGSGGMTARVITPTNAFPGLEGSDYLRFSNLSPIATTLDDQDRRPGVIITVPQGSRAHIAAIQIRGEFVPEPASGVALGAPVPLIAAICRSQSRHTRARRNRFSA